MMSSSVKSFLSRSHRIILIDLRKCSSQTNAVLNKSSPTPDGSEQKLLKVAVVGMPNAGKSTFINNLMDRRVCPTSSKVHTTRTKSMAIFTHEDAQIVFLDTPGLVNDRELKKYKLEKSYVKDGESCLRQADVISVIHDASDSWNRERLDIKIVKLLEDNKKKPSVLILNKIDVLKSKRKLLDITRLLTENCINGKSFLESAKAKKNDSKGWPYFSEVFMVSSITGGGLPDVKQYLVEKSRPGEWMFPSNVYSDQTAENIVINSVKAKLLDFLPQEIPYLLKPCIELFDIDGKGVIKAVVLVKCPSMRISKLIAGVSNGRLRQIIESVQDDLQSAFQNFVKINIVLEGPKVDK